MDYKNEAAERLRHTQRVNFRSEEDVDLALAEERRHVIEQIRERLDAADALGPEIVLVTYSILDDLSDD